MNKKFLLNEILDHLNCDYYLLGNIVNKFVKNAKPILEADEYSLSFIHIGRTDKSDLISKSAASIIICDSEIIDLVKKKNTSACYVIVAKPKETFAKLVNFLFKASAVYGIHPTATIHSEAIIHAQTFIGPNTYIGKCSIDEGTVIYGNTYLYDNVNIGRNVIINANCTIGAAGFGYLKDDDGVAYNFPHIGSVIIGDNVEIGCNTCVDRGALGATIIKSGAKIDNLVHIAHTVVIGNNVWVIANSMIGGSTIIGDNTYIAPSSCIRDAITIGENVTIGMGAVVTKNVPENEIWTGSPAIELEKFKERQEKIKKI